MAWNSGKGTLEMAEAAALNSHVIQRFESDGGAEVFLLPIEIFPGMSANVYLIHFQDYLVLVDCGSNFHKANQQLEEQLNKAGELLGEPVDLAALTHILITHGHIDHFGGLAHIAPKTSALIGIHELDLRNLANFEERLIMVSRLLRQFLNESGFDGPEIEELIELYMLPKSLFASVRVDFTLSNLGNELEPFRFLHVPGHSAGHVVIRLHDLLFSGDHVLKNINPHLAPESLTQYTGLAHYLQSLQALQAWAGNPRLTLCGHEDPIERLDQRIDELRQLHEQRLERALKFMGQPHTVKQVAEELFNRHEGYDYLLAVEEAGAYVEYLYQRGLLAIENLDKVNAGKNSVPIRFRRQSDKLGLNHRL
jgi:glyoxylase-like metal-dependent hydrolase (beta-lactamase superfamily II)